MQTSLEKKAIFEKANFSYHFDRQIYISRQTKKVFSYEYIADHLPEVLEQNIDKKNNSNKWVFYFNNPVSESVKNEIKNALDK